MGDHAAIGTGRSGYAKQLAKGIIIYVDKQGRHMLTIDNSGMRYLLRTNEIH